MSSPRQRPPFFQMLAQRQQALLIAGLFAAYLIGFVLLYPRLGASVASFIFVPILGAAYLLGAIGGAGTWAFGVTAQIIMFRLLDSQGWVAVFQLNSLIGLAALLLVAVMIGKIRDANRRLETELNERRKAEARLNDSQRFTARIADTIPDLLYLYDLRENRVLYINRQVETLLRQSGRREDEPPLAIIRDLVHPDDLALFERAQETFAATKDGEFAEADFRLRDGQGGYRWYHVRSSVFERDSQGKARCVLGLARDVTALKQAAALAHEREKAQIALEKERELTRLKNRFMMTISHEFRTPLAIILSSSELLERYHDRLSQERRSECLRAISVQVRHMRDMLSEVSLLLETEARKPTFMPAQGNLAEFCEQVKARAELASNYSHPITLSVTGDLDAILFDENILDTILKQLLINAIKYSPPGTLIRLDARREPDGVTLAVQDMGIGIPAEDLERVFDTFYRGNNVTHIPGIGLGLKIVRDYTALHQGVVRVTSEEGRGTTFTVWLPLDYT